MTGLSNYWSSLSFEPITLYREREKDTGRDTSRWILLLLLLLLQDTSGSIYIIFKSPSTSNFNPASIFSLNLFIVSISHPHIHPTFHLLLLRYQHLNNIRHHICQYPHHHTPCQYYLTNKNDAIESN